MKKKCGYTHADVRLYLQNRMIREEETEFQQHLQNCENCREELIVLRRITRSISKKERRTVSFRTWMITASLACLIIGEGFYCYYLIKDGNTPFHREALRNSRSILRFCICIGTVLPRRTVSPPTPCKYK